MKNRIILIVLLLAFGCITFQPDTVSAETLSPKKLADIRSEITNAVQDSASGVHPGWNKPQINAISQAIEDWYSGSITSTTQSGKLQLNSVVTTEATVQGLTLTALQKKVIVAIFWRHKIKEELGK